jgi:hypothetical protein
MNEMEVESTTLRAVAYDDGRGVLQLEFCIRAIYDYYGVLCASAQTGLAGEG